MIASKFIRSRLNRDNPDWEKMLQIYFSLKIGKLKLFYNLKIPTQSGSEDNRHIRLIDYSSNISWCVFMHLGVRHWTNMLAWA